MIFGLFAFAAVLLALPWGSRLCLADGGGGRDAAGAPPQAKDLFFKLLTGEDLGSFFQVLGLSPDIAAGAVIFPTELVAPDATVRRPDFLFRTSGGDFYLVEFQSDANYLDIARFLKYAALVMEKYSREEERLVRVHVVVVYSGGVRRPSWVADGGGDSLGSGLGPVTFRLFFLEEKLDFVGAVCKAWCKIAGWAKDAACRALSPSELAELYLAPFGHLPKFTSDVSRLYLTCGLRLSKTAGDPSILRTMLLAVRARGNIVTKADFKIFIKELGDMGSNIMEFVDDLTDDLAEGKYSAILAQLKSKDAQLESKDAQLEFKDAQLADLTPFAVLGLRASGKSAEEISAKMNLEKSEVAKILEDADAGR